jgi:DDE superfamily endonuclease
MANLSLPIQSFLAEEDDGDVVLDNVDVCSNNDELAHALVFHDILIKAITKIKLRRTLKRSASPFEQRLLWDNFCNRFRYRHDFKRHLRMTSKSFDKLLEYLYNDLTVDVGMADLRGGAILPEICLYATIRYFAGGSYLDIKFFTGISSASFYRCVWRTVKAIRKSSHLLIHFPTTTDELASAADGFRKISSNSAIENCVSVVDGYHLEIITPTRKEVQNVRSFFSGHYQTYGVNVQASCDHHCRFTFLGVAGPGVMGDREAIYEVSLGKKINALPHIYCVIGDCAYTPTEHLVPIYRGANATLPRNDNFNFYASQLRIRIEMAFGLLVKKWSILQRPLSIKMKHLSKLIVAIAQLHNFCINERLMEGMNENTVFTPANVELETQYNRLRNLSANFDFQQMVLDNEVPWSHNRDRMSREIDQLQLTRPQLNRRI